MSEQATLITARHVEYLSARTTREDVFLKDLKQAALDANIPAIWISPAQAAFMQILLKLCRAKEVVEVGTLAGYSAIAMARALPAGGRVRTIEIEPAFADFSEAWIGRSDVADRIQVLRGDACAVLPSLDSDSADAAFLDADKTGYGDYLEHSLRIVRRGGLIMVDNAFAFGQLFDDHPTDPEAPAVKAFNERMAAEKRLQSIIAPFGDGCWVGVRL